MADLIYSVRNIFNDKNQDGCLAQHEVSKYLIPSYQRGYKWASDDGGAVTILLNDLKKAFDLNKKEYYLQYITVKETKDEINGTVLELIDGQQRLTTLSILIAVVTSILNEEDFADNKLDYAVRGDFFQKSIHNRDTLKQYLTAEWNVNTGFLGNNSQDIYYIVSAAQTINSFIDPQEKLDTSVDQKKKQNALFDPREKQNVSFDPKKMQNDFFAFVADNVKIIVNVVDRGDSERVFSNLNSNKVSLTEAELIKGILLTKVSRGEDKRKRFREITEERMKLGMLWDEMARWCNSPEVRSFYFNDKSDGMTELMKFALYYKYPKNSYDEKKDPKDYPLFNCYLELPNHQEAYQAIVDSYRVLKDLYEDSITYNLMGYLIHEKGSKMNSCISFLKNENTDSGMLTKYMKSELSKSAFKKEILAKIKSVLPQEPEKLWFGKEDDVSIHRVLLALNVFRESKNAGISLDTKFDYYNYKKNKKWTLEHIFPQQPEGNNKTLVGDKLAEVKTLLKTVNDKEKVRQALEFLDLPKRDDDQKAIVHEALGLVVNTIGNLCLLTDSDNSSNSNEFFDEKRSNILNRITSGSFVPPHTYEIFSKTIFPNDPRNLTLWGKNDMDEHTKIISKRIQKIRDYNF